MATALKHPDHEHPIVAWVGILATLATMLLILWASVEVHGTRHLEAALLDESAPPSAARHKPSAAGDNASQQQELDEAVAAGRWAAGFSP